MMSISSFSVAKFQVSFHGDLSPDKRFSRRKKCGVIRCCDRKVGERARSEMNHYDLLGVSVDSNSQEIKEAYRKLQKKYHPDIAGQKGHAHTLKLNEAYKVLMRNDLRRGYDASIGRTRVSFGLNTSSLGYSSWNGALRPHALFVDQNALQRMCAPCEQHFMMDESIGCARVKVQYGDSEKNIEVSVESCPVNCIHWVKQEELAVLEFLSQPQPKEGYGVFGGGWERPANIFMAAKAFNKQLKRQAENQRSAQATADEETPAQAEARANASVKIKMEKISGIWNWIDEVFCS